ncbi:MULTISPECIES: HNH endonuclease signature motif containing protein [unclassified Rhodococcus (in: high G+C Gram-positive bacteria)]|uniref:HNH endonuclease signature motif containing protein n=1 Tax=unclassified Rhodococcus (in: high G+C Gram-positive bacteria) TaxID=192944 RepID=UPI00211B65C2|nr:MULTISPECIES: HNH endonuclease signature motif containing protein [unclassified Rhodococcus (in: high G+C Gram-positive bacteria)]
MKTWGDVFGLGDQELVSELADVASLENALAATRLTLLAEMDRRGLAMKLGHSSVTRWYARSVRITDGSAARQMELGQWLTEWPSVSNALAGGDIHAAHTSAIADGYATVVVADPTLDEQRRDAVVAELLETAMRSTAGQVTSRAQALAHSAADDARARHKQAEKQRQEQEQEREQASRADTGSSDTDDPGNSGDAGTSSDTGRSGEPEPAGPEPAGPEPVPPGPPPVPVSENPDLNRFDVHPLAGGRFQIGGNVDRLLAEKLLTVLSPLTAPRPGPGGERDPRGPSKRRADALDQILDRHLHGSSRGSAGGSRASVHLIVPLRELLTDSGRGRSACAPTGSTPPAADAIARTGDTCTSPSGVGGGHGVPESSVSAGGGHRVSEGAGAGAGDNSRTDNSRTHDSSSDSGQRSAPEPGDAEWPFHFDWTGPISRSLAELLTCDADLTPVIVDHHGVPLALGRTTRLASDDQRIALTIRDTCCVMCGRPAQWCQAHHVTFWEHGGPTDLNNLALVCGECHRLVHHGDWQLFMGDDGHPYAIPPESIDPSRRPIPSYHRRKRRAA